MERICFCRGTAGGGTGVSPVERSTGATPVPLFVVPLFVLFPGAGGADVPPVLVPSRNTSAAGPPPGRRPLVRVTVTVRLVRKPLMSSTVIVIEFSPDCSGTPPAVQSICQV